MLNLGSNFIFLSIILDKIFMIIFRYGGLLLTLFISFVISSYLYFIIEFNFHSLVRYNLFNRPEIVVKYFWTYIQYYYENRAQLPISVTLKLILILLIPLLVVKLIKILIQFLLFYIAIKWQKKIPTISGFILRRTLLANSIFRTYDENKKTDIKKNDASQNYKTIINNKSDNSFKKNLRK